MPVLESWQRYLYLYRKERLKPVLELDTADGAPATSGLVPLDDVTESDTGKSGGRPGAAPAEEASAAHHPELGAGRRDTQPVQPDDASGRP